MFANRRFAIADRRSAADRRFAIANRRFAIAIAASLAIHALVFSIPVKQKPGEQTLSSMLRGPLQVRIVAAPETPVEKVEPVAEPSPVPERPPVIPPRPPMPRAPARTAEARVPPLPAPEPEPRATPQFDMMAAINARRERRRAAEAAEAAASPPAEREPTAQEAAVEAINRNLRTSPREGVGGVFTILRKGARTAEFAFNGWRPDSYRQWREVIEVDAGPGGDVERAIAKRMIELIRSHYTGDFLWESHQLGRTVTLSARPEDNDGLEEFLMREFWGTPMLRR